MSRTLLHLLSDEQWPAAFPIPPGVEGFIHLCTPQQAAGVLERFFGGGPAWALVLDPAVEADVRDEDSYGHGSFPHLYAPLEASAVLGHVRLSASDDIVARVAERTPA